MPNLARNSVAINTDKDKEAIIEGIRN